jgi:hypothetical protein
MDFVPEPIPNQDICMGRHIAKMKRTAKMAEVVAEARRLGARGFVRRGEGMWYIIDPAFAGTREALLALQQAPRARASGLRGTHPDGQKYTSYILS